MEKNKSNKKLVIVLIVIIIILLLVSGFLGYKLLSNNNTNTNDIENNNQQTSGNKVLDTITEKELQSTFKFVYDYYHTGNGYCGSYINEDTISPNDNKANFYTASSSYKSFDEMISNLQNYMTETVIYEKYSMKRENYIEQNEKLYCPNYGKGGNLLQVKDIEITTNNIIENNINAIVKVTLTYETDTTEETYNINFAKNNQDKWLVSSYEIQQ